MNSYIEKEIKILNIDVKDVQLHLEKLHARPVYVGQRIISTFDYNDGQPLSPSGEPPPDPSKRGT